MKLFIFVLVVLLIIVVILSLKEIPEGYEDEDGFHHGKRKE